ncbi:MAG: DegT/DnrJ/EryC1/StrS family aminotransferase [Actinobacteria bacterium]|nr:DegT/DnrJ/EryC1/StrS family aminotransferase [Actinomycetota bacterium]
MIPISRPVTGSEEIAAMSKVFDSAWLGLGAVTYEFENTVAEYLGARNVIAVNTGTSALHLALSAIGIGPGDEVIVPSLTFAATIQPIISLGATPVFVESRDEDLFIDPDHVRRAITPRTKAVMPVLYCGNPGGIDDVYALAAEHGIRVVEDAAHAFGSQHADGTMVGGKGDLVCFSFDPIKNITTGEGGAVALEDDGLAEELRRQRMLGIDKDTWNRYKNTRSYLYQVISPGYRYHMPNYAAAVGLEQMKRLPGFIARRREIARRYDAAFADLPGIVTMDIDYDRVAPHIYIIRVAADERDGFMMFLKDRDVGTGLHYIANHVQPMFAPYVTEALPRVDRLWQEIVTIPLHCAMSDDDVETVISAIREYAAERVAS